MPWRIPYRCSYDLVVLIESEVHQATHNPSSDSRRHGHLAQFIKPADEIVEHDIWRCFARQIGENGQGPLLGLPFLYASRRTATASLTFGSVIHRQLDGHGMHKRRDVPSRSVRTMSL